jgi:putative restriction endonuclease
MDWYQKLAKLRVDKSSKNPAPHKPLLLLAILDQIENGVITSNVVRLTPELAFQFLGYWEIVSHRGRSIGRVDLPFFYLRGDGFLKHIAFQGLESALDCIKPTSLDSLNKIISHAEIPESFFELMQSQENRDRARNILISANWFYPDEQIKLFSILELETRILDKKLEIDLPENEIDFKQGRDIKFRFQIVPLYRFSCVLCGIKMLLPSGVTLVEAAHIHQFSHSRNDDITNGIALCRNHHWAFDQGLWTINQEFKVMVACGAFTEQAINQPSLESYHFKQLDFSWIPLAYLPSNKNLEWHRKYKFLGQIS